MTINHRNKCNKKIFNFKSKLSIIPPNLNIAKADSGASTHSFCISDKKLLNNIRKMTNAPKCQLPDGTIISPKEQGEIKQFKNLSESAKLAYVHPALKSASLISIGQLCDDGCTATFDKTKLEIIKNNKIIVQGHRNPDDGLWDIPLDTTPNNIKINAIIRKNSTKHKLANYLHACAGSPSLSTFQKAIKKGYFLSWPGIEEINFEKYIPNQEATAKGHMDQEKQGLQSTKQDFEPSKEEKSNTTMTSIFPLTPKELSYSDQTGKFPFRSSRGYEYVMIIYDHDSNAILARPFKTRQAKELVDTWKLLYNDLTKNGHKTKAFIMDNECSSEMKNALKKYNLEYQLVPPEIHHRNAAERAIRTFKNHFLSC